MTKLLLALSGLLLVGCAAPVGFVATAATHHSNRAARMEEFNPGLGVELGDTWRAQGGVFRNSLGDFSPYAGGGYWFPGDYARVGFFAALAWYETNGLMVLGGPSIEIGNGLLRPRISWMPDAGQRGGSVFLLQIGVRL